MNRRPVHFALRELMSLLRTPRLWMAFAVVVVLFAVTGPFGTFERMPLPLRFAYWFGTQAVCWLIALTSISITAAVLNKSVKGNLQAVVIGAAAAAPLIAVFVEINLWVLFDTPISWTGLGVQTLYSLPLSLMFGGLAYLLTGAAPSAPETAEPARNRLVERLPFEKRGTLLYLSMQDHYVEIVTDKGRELILLRLGDAIAEIPEGLGLQIHRSHWVARDAVASSRREGGKLVLTTVDGTELPVSRSYAKAAKEAGIA